MSQKSWRERLPGWLLPRTIPTPPHSKTTSQNERTISALFNITPHKRTPYTQFATTMDMGDVKETNAVAVYCASSMGNDAAYQAAAISVGKALGKAGRPLVYGGGRKGIMGVVSGAVLEAGGRVTGCLPAAMIASGGEQEAVKTPAERKAAAEALCDGTNRENETTVIVDSMHERKLEMAKRACGFICLPGGFGTFEELMEVTTWSQLGIHNKPTLVLNVRGYYNPLRELIRTGVREGFIHPQNEKLVMFVDGPEDVAQHGEFDWGGAALEALEGWQAATRAIFYDWTKRKDGSSSNVLAST